MRKSPSSTSSIRFIEKKRRHLLGADPGVGSPVGLLWPDLLLNVLPSSAGAFLAGAVTHCMSTRALTRKNGMCPATINRPAAPALDTLAAVQIVTNRPTHEPCEDNREPTIAPERGTPG